MATRRLGPLCAAVVVTVVVALAGCSAPVTDFPAAAPPASFPGDERFVENASLTPLAPAPAAAPQAAPTTNTTAAAVTTTTAQPTFVHRAYTVGECLALPAGSTGPNRALETVDCNGTHLYEVVGIIDLNATLGPVADYPPAATWAALLNGECRARLESYLGKPLDPGGRLQPDAIGPTQDGWAQGERTLWCIVGARKYRLDEEGGEPMPGPAKTLEQTMPLPVGTCIRVSEPGPDFSVVPCTTEHTYEVTGLVDLSMRGAIAPTDAEWQGVMSEQCGIASTSYLGRKPASTERPYWFKIDDRGWTAGRRSAECLIGKVDAANKPLVLTRPLR